MCFFLDRLEATCVFDSSERKEATSAGATHSDEMCNLYLITWCEQAQIPKP